MIVEAIRTAILSAIGAATTPTYNYTYPVVNVHDRSQWGANPVVLWTSNLTESERPNSEGVTNYYWPNVPMEIKAWVRATSTPFDTGAALEKVRADMKKVFDLNHATFQTAGMVDFEFAVPAKEYRNSKDYPGEIIIPVVFSYRQSRL
jgi:hypothetical protein